MKALVRLLCFAALALSIAACATVHPWQRERLAAPCMQMDGPGGASAYELHVRAIRIGDVHPSANGGGGCGCN